MSNCLHCGIKNPPSNGNRARKYCSKKCSNEYYKSQNTYYTKKNEDWGTRGAKRKKAIEEKKRVFAWHKDNWLTAQQVGDILGITTSTVHVRSKKAGVRPKIISRGIGGHQAFWNPEDVDKLRYKPMPEGYITTNEARRMLGSDYIKKYNINASTADIVFEDGSTSRAYLHSKEKIIALVAKKEQAIKQYHADVQKRREEKKEQLAQLRIEKAAAKKLAAEKREIEKAEQKIRRQKLRELKAQEALERKRQKDRARIVKREDDWQDVDVREQRLFDSFERKLLKTAGMERHSLHINAMEKNYEYRDLKDNKGFTTTFICGSCNKELPYYEFYYDETSKTGRRMKKCITCTSKISKERYRKNKEKHKLKRKENYRGKMRTIIALTVKQDVSRHRKSYAKDLGVPFVWEKIEKNCGYTIDDFIAHIESQWKEGMHWLNHGRGPDTWQVDHIKPRDNFFYTDLDDPQFIECWSLDNMQPLTSYNNAVKDNILIKQKGLNPQDYMQ